MAGRVVAITGAFGVLGSAVARAAQGLAAAACDDLCAGFHSAVADVLADRSAHAMAMFRAAYPRLARPCIGAVCQKAPKPGKHHFSARNRQTMLAGFHRQRTLDQARFVPHHPNVTCERFVNGTAEWF